MLKLNSFRDLNRFNFGPVIQVQRAGGFYKARYAGCSSFVFGSNPEEARQRLLNTPLKCARNTRRNSEIKEHNWGTGFRG